MTTIVNNFSYGDEAKQPGIPGAPLPSVVFQRLDAVDDQLQSAEQAAYELVRLLAPVLPVGFGDWTEPPVQPLDIEQPSMLAHRLADITARSARLVMQLRTIRDAVDL